MPVSKYSPLNSSRQCSQSCDQFTSIPKKYHSGNDSSAKKPDNRCLQNNLVYVINMPLWLEDQNVVKKDIFFGKYGNITSIITSVVDSAKTKIPNSKYIQAYITYDNQKDAALAIAAVNQVKYLFRVLRATYGTNRLCTNYLKGQKCRVKNCFYLHDEVKCMKIEGPLKTDFQKQKHLAYDIIKKNLPYYMKKIEQEKLSEKDRVMMYQDKGESFPSIKFVIEDLLKKNIINKTAYVNATQQEMASNKRMSQTVKKIQYIRYRVKSNVQKRDNQIENQPKSIDIKQLNNEPQNVQNVYNLEKKQVLQNLIQSQNGLNAGKINIQKKIRIQEKTQIQAKSHESFQFLMSKIMDDQKENCKIAINKKSKVQKYDEILQISNIFGSFKNKKDSWQQQLLQTQESEEQSLDCSLDISPRVQSSPVFSQGNSLYEQSFQQIQADQEKILFKIRTQIMKKRLVKISKLEFTQDSTFQQSEYSRITQILKKKLIK